MEHHTTQKHSHIDSPRSNFIQFVKDVVWFSLIALLIVIPVRTYVAQPFIVSGASMAPTFHTSDYLIIDQVSYRLDEPKRGEVVIFRFPENPDQYFIKRIIGLPNETLALTHETVTISNEIHPEGFLLNEPYLTNRGNGRTLSVTLGENEYFVLGDNRPASSDSRIWGPLPRTHIVGEALLRLLPVSNVTLYPGKIAYE